MAKNLLSGIGNLVLSVDGSDLTLSWDSCCSDTGLSSTVTLPGFGEGGVGAFTYLRSESGTAPASPTAPNDPPGSPSNNDVVIEVWDDKTILWLRASGAWTLVDRLITGPELAAAAAPGSNPATWPVTTGRAKFIYSNDANGNGELIGIIDAAGTAHPIKSSVYHQVTNGPTGIGTDPENPSTSEFLVHFLGAGRPAPIAGDIIEYTAPSGNVYLYDVMQDDGSTAYVYYKREGGCIYFTDDTGAVDADDPSTWTDLGPCGNIITNATDGLLAGVVDDAGDTFKVARTYHIEMGKIGVVTTDSGAANEQPQTLVGNLTAVKIKTAQCRLVVPATGATTFQVHSINSGTNAATQLGVYTIAAGQRTVTMADLVGDTLAASSILALYVNSGSDGRHLSVTLTVEG